MTVAIETGIQPIQPNLEPAIKPPLSENAAWNVACRAVEKYRFCLPCMCHVAPSAVERAARLACQNLQASVGITPSTQGEIAQSLAFEHTPNYAEWLERRPNDRRTWALGLIVGLGDESLHSPPSPKPQALDTDAVKIIGEALRLEATFSPDLERRAEADDVLRNGTQVFGGALALAA